MAVKTENRYELSDFSVDIFEENDLIKVRVDCFADDGNTPPFIVSSRGLIDSSVIRHRELFYTHLAGTLTECINKVLSSEITPPEKCECQDRDWFRHHPEDRQEYWRTKAGRVYAKDHTVLCPNNPTNRRKKNG